MESHPQHTRYETMLPFLWGYAVLLFLVGFIHMDSPSNLIAGLGKIIVTEDALITDYVLVAGTGAALINQLLGNRCQHPHSFAVQGSVQWRHANCYGTHVWFFFIRKKYCEYLADSPRYMALCQNPP